MAKQVLTYTMTAPYTFLSGLILISELLPIPLPVQTNEVRIFSVLFTFHFFTKRHTTESAKCKHCMWLAVMADPQPGTKKNTFAQLIKEGLGIAQVKPVIIKNVPIAHCCIICCRSFGAPSWNHLVWLSVNIVSSKIFQSVCSSVYIAHEKNSARKRDRRASFFCKSTCTGFLSDVSYHLHNNIL